MSKTLVLNKSLALDWVVFTPQYWYIVAWGGFVHLASVNTYCFSDNAEDGATEKMTPHMKYVGNQGTTFLFNSSFNLVDVHYRK